MLRLHSVRMNQVIKELIYGKGTMRQVEFMAKLGGMNEEETKVFKLLHQLKSETYIELELGMSRKTYERIEESVRAKLLIAVFTCINKTYDLFDKEDP